MNTAGARVLEGAAVKQVLSRGPLRGYVLRSEKGGKVSLVPWQQAARVPLNGKNGKEGWNPKVMVQNIPVPGHVHQAMINSLPPEIRRTPRQRYQVLVTRLVMDAMKSKRLYGRVIWPKSIEDEINRCAWLEGDPGLLQRIETGAQDAIERYAGYLMRQVAGLQKETDHKKTALDWHGHYNN